MAFTNSKKIDLRYSIINNAKRDQTNVYHVGGTARPNLTSPTPAYDRPSAPPDEDEEAGGESSSDDSDNDDPPSWVEGHPDPPSWTQGHPDPPSWNDHSRVPRPSWVLPKTKAGTDQRARSGRQVRSLPSVFDQTPLSDHPDVFILHTKCLPTSNKLVDEALTHSSADVSPWQHPVAWISADTKYIDSIIQDVALLTRNEEIKFTDTLLAYPRLIKYLFIHLMHCVRDQRLLNELKENTGKWKTWDSITVIQNHEEIKNYLRGLFEVLQSVSDLHTNKTFENLLAYDVIGLAARLTSIVTDDNLYKELVARTGEEAQSLVNLLHARLDLWIYPKFKARHVKTLVKLSRASARYPDCLVLKDVELVGDPVAEGGFGQVYKGHIGDLDLAIKVLKVNKQLDTGKLRKQFSCEAVTWRRVSHANILQFYGIYRLDDTESPKLCLVMPWMENGDMVHYLAEVAPNANCVLLSWDVAQGLEYLHKECIVHSDLKGHNILISAAGRACLADFGLATVKDSMPVDMTKTTVGTRREGTMQWQAPELLEGEGPTTFASDMYAFAMVCYEMFSGEYPFVKLNQYKFTLALVQGERPSRPTHALSETRGLNDEVWRLMERCWSQLPSDRPAADQVVEALCHTNRTLDTRPLDNLSTASPSQMWNKQEHHPFSALTLRNEDNDSMRKLKNISEVASSASSS